MIREPHPSSKSDGDAPSTTLFLGPPPCFARTDSGPVFADVEGLQRALDELDGRATVVVTADVSERELSTLGEHHPEVQWWCAHGGPCADRYARHAMPRALAHAIRSPLGVLEGAADELESRLRDDGPEWGMMRRGLARLKRLAVSLSDVASISRKSPAVTDGQSDAVSLRDVVHSAWGDACKQWPLRREIDLELDSQALAGHAPAQTEALQRALRELFINARQHGASHVRVEAAIDGSGTRLEVLDDGPGPGPASDSSNWSPFVSAHDRGARTDLALGLGIVRHDARAFGGQLDITARDGDMGTRARLSWPVQPA